jgi:hypothetical protein
VDRDDFESFVFGEGWEDGWEAACEHCFSRAWRAHEQDIVSASRCDLECAFRAVLPCDIGEVDIWGLDGERLGRWVREH